MDGPLSPAFPVRTAEKLKSFESRFDRRRPLFWLALLFCGGICADAVVQPALATLGGIFLALCLAAAALLLLRRPTQPRWQIFALAALCAVVCGFTLHAVRARIPRSDDLSRHTSAAPSLVTLRGYLTETAPQPTPAAAAIWTLAPTELGEMDRGMPVTGGVQLRILPPGIAAQLGDFVEVRLRLEAPPDVTLPDSFDLSSFLLSRGIRRVGETNGAQIRVLHGPPLWRPDLHLRRFAQTLSARVEASLPASGGSGQAGLLNALLFGRRDRLDASDREAFAISGTAHLLAISGLQIQFLAWLLWRLGSALGVSRRRSAGVVLLLTVAYCLLAGADAPVFRATVMIGLYLSALVFWRQLDPVNVLAAAALVILTLSPGELFNAAFQLSFLAVLALVTIYPALQHAWAQWQAARNNLPDVPAEFAVPDDTLWFGSALPRSSKDWIRDALLLTLAAWLATAPCVAWHMGRFATLSLFVNLLAVPLGSLCMLGGIALLGAGIASSSLALALGWGVALLLGLLQWLNAAVAALPFASINLPPPAVPLLLVYAAIMLWIWIERGRGVTLPRLALIVPGCLVVLCAGAFFREPAPAPLVTLLDLPQGRCTLVESPAGGAALLDAGGLGQGPRIAELLRRRGIDRLSLLAISADDPDAIEGAAELARRIPIARVILPRATTASRARRDFEAVLRDKAIPHDDVKSTASLRGPGDIQWELWDDGPAADVPVGSETALGIRLTLPGTRVLFIDARSGAALQRLLAKIPPEQTRADFLRVTAGPSRRIPNELAQFVAASECRTLILGSRGDADDYSGLDLEQLAAARNLRLLTPYRDGSLRIEAGTQFNHAPAVQSFRAGSWQTPR